jgi:lysosomal acid lipase/cholesteryl ester hydrolase
MQEIIENNGYAYEEHTAITEDGYILKIHRIPYHNSDSTPHEKRPVVLMQHGLGGDSSNWIINEPLMAPAFVLVNEGYDVWLGNNRGNHYSLKH